MNDEASKLFQGEAAIREDLLQRFEEAWARGSAPTIEEYLHGAGSRHGAVLTELVHIDLERRLKAGQAVRVEDYLQRFPELLANRPTVLDLVVAECRLRRGREPHLSPDEYAGRFPHLAGDLAGRLDIAAGAAGDGETTATVPAAAESFGEGQTTPKGLSESGGGSGVPGYEILAELGRGGMGVVYRARHQKLGRTVALKMILAGTHADEEDRRRFLAEAEAVAKLQHPNIVPLYEYGQHHGLPYFTLEFVRGGSLADRLRQGPLLPQEAAQLVEQLARGMAHAHQHGIVHRDLKPHNVLLQSQRAREDTDPTNHSTLPSQSAASAAVELTPKITDFGLAKRVQTGSGLTATGAILGTPSYMAPEQAKGDGKRVGPAADVYALGAILYECLTGRPPFQGPTPLDTLQQVVGNEPVPPRRVQPKVPKDLETVCLKCLHKEPHKRYTTAAALANDLRCVQGGEPIRARPVGRGERLVKWVKRRPALAGLIVTITLLLLTVTIGGPLVAVSLSRQAADREHRQELRERAIAEALNQAKEIHGELLGQLTRPSGVRNLLNNPAAWEQRLQSAQNALQRARDRQKDAEDPVTEELLASIESLEGLLARAEADRKLAVALEKIRLDRAAIVEGQFNSAGALQAYAVAFQQAHLDMQQQEVDALARRIQQSPIQEQLLAALDDWVQGALAAKQQALVWRLLAVARQAERDPWQKRLRDRKVWLNPGEVKKLLATLSEGPRTKLPSEQLSPQLLSLVGELLLAVGEKAETWLRHSQAVYPGDFWLNLKLGNVLLEKNAEEAIGFYRAALAIRPHNATVINNLGVALYLQRHYDGAMTHFQQALRLDPKLALAHNNWGNALDAQLDHGGAIFHYQQALKLDPNFAAVHHNFGLALAGQQDFKRAILHYQKALQLNPSWAIAHLSWGDALAAQRDYDGAITHYRQALKLDPKDAKADVIWGNALQAQRDYDGAITHYRQALKLDPNTPLAHINWGWALQAQQDFGGAIAHYRQALKLDPNLAQAHNHWGTALNAQQDHGGAILHYQQALKLDPNLAQAHFNWGNALQAQQHYGEAITHYRQTLGLDPNDAQAHLNWGNALRAQQDYAAALRHYRQALKLDPNFAQAHLNVGSSLSFQRDYDAAIPHFQQALQLDPKDGQIHGALGQALLARGEFGRAEQATRRCLQLLVPGHPLRGPMQSQLQQCQQAQPVVKRALALAQGQVRPTGPAELLQLAQFSRQYRRYRAATQLYAAALDAQPPLAGTVAKGLRAEAARAAALASGGQGWDAQKLEAKERAELRRQALTWLRTELTQHGQTVAGYHNHGRPLASPLEKLTGKAQQSGPVDLLRVCDRLTAWQTDPDLASLREAKALAQLPAAEQKDWRQLWADVRSMLEQARRCFTETRHEGALTAQHKEQVHEVQMHKGQTYVIDLQSQQFDAFLRLEDAQGKALAENDDREPGVILDSRLVLTASQDGTYRLVATSVEGRGAGAYTLTIRAFSGDQK